MQKWREMMDDAFNFLIGRWKKNSVSHCEIFSHGHATLHVAVSVGRSEGQSVTIIFQFGAVFALLLLRNPPQLDCRVAGLVCLNLDCYSMQLFWNACSMTSMLIQLITLWSQQICDFLLKCWCDNKIRLLCFDCLFDCLIRNFDL